MHINFTKNQAIDIKNKLTIHSWMAEFDLDGFFCDIHFHDKEVAFSEISLWHRILSGAHPMKVTKQYPVKKMQHFCQ